MKKKENSPKPVLSPVERSIRRCMLCQCFTIGGWLMLLLIKFGVGFPLSSEIGKCAIFITALFLIEGIVTIRLWDRYIVRIRPETICLKDSSEVLHHLFDVLYVVSALMILCMLAALVMLLFFHFKTTAEPVRKFLTDWPLYVLTLCWIGNAGYFIYDVVTLRLFLKNEAEEEPVPVAAGAEEGSGNS